LRPIHYLRLLLGRASPIKAKPNGSTAERLEWIQESRLPGLLCFGAALAVVVVTGLNTGFAVRDLTPIEKFLMVISLLPAGLLLTFSLFGLITYFVFIPSVSRDGHIFSRVHAAHLLHPLMTSLVIGLFGVCVYTGAAASWGIWCMLLAVYILQTALVVRKVRHEPMIQGPEDKTTRVAFIVLNLMVGGELVTLAAGARSLPPWRMDTLPEDTWILDVRTKPEFHWNRLQGAESFPWGKGIVEAAADQPRDRPVLVTCLSGHRSPAVAVLLKRLGFKTVYNLNWGILYLMLLQTKGHDNGPFSLTRTRRDPHRRGEDLAAITRGYVSLVFLTLICAPLQRAIVPTEPSLLRISIGAMLGLLGLALIVISYRALGRNFRIYAAPRRSGTLITTGIYSRIRHPMYSGVIIGLAGYVILFGSYYCAPLWLGCTLLYLIKGVKEDRILAEKFPDYLEYKRRTWRFLPYIN